MFSENVLKFVNGFFKVVINNRDLEMVRSRMLPTINLDNTNEILSVLLKKFEDELLCLYEFDMLDKEDEAYKKYLTDIIALFGNEMKKEKLPDYSDGKVYEKNILLFSPKFVEQLLEFEDLEYISIIKRCLELLENKQITTENYSNFSDKYKRLHGEASGLSEVIGDGLRILHMPIDKNLWVVLAVVKKKATRDKKHNDNLVRYKNYGLSLIENVRSQNIVNGKLDYSSVIRMFEANYRVVHEFLENSEEKKNGKKL